MRKKNITSDHEFMIGEYSELLTTWAARTHLHEATIIALGEVVEVVAEASVIHITVQIANALY